MNACATRESLGRSSVSVSRLGFGTTGLGNIMRETPAADAAAAVEAAWTSGLRYFDTAPQYGQGLAEQRLGEALRGRPRAEYVVSTKIGKLLEPASAAPDGLFVGGGAYEIAFDYSYDGTLRSLDASLGRLRLDRVDVLLIHDVNRRYHGEGVHDRLDEAMGGAVKALERLRKEGVIGAYGPAFNDVDILMRFVAEADIDCLMLPRGYSLLHQEASAELLPECLRRDIAVLIASPFESGILATGTAPGATYLYAPADEAVRARVRRLESICAAHGVPLGAAALQFSARHPAVVSVVVGMRSAREVTENARLMNTDIPRDLWQALEREGLIPAAKAR